jgi:hypothetical protein
MLLLEALSRKQWSQADARRRPGRQVTIVTFKS